MLFEFRLRPIDQIDPFGTVPDARLHWFGLTDGFYRLKVGSEYVLNYTEEMIRLYPVAPDSPEPTWIDYYLSRLGEDLLEILPTVFNPLPPQICQWVSLDDHIIRPWVLKLYDWEEKHNQDGANATVDKAFSWNTNRYLDVGYLQNSPLIKLWSDKQKVYIKWESKNVTLEGISVWSSMGGIYSLERSEFMREIHLFFNSLMAQMEDRVNAVTQHWSRPEIQIDVPGLRQEHEARVKAMKQILDQLTQLPAVNWDEVIEAIKSTGIGFPGE